MPRKPAFVGRAEVAKVFGVAPGRINKWVSDGCPAARRGRRGLAARYDIAAIRTWLEAREARAATQGLSLEHERTLLARAQRLKVEIDNAVRRCELLSRDQVVFEGIAYTKAWASHVRALPRRARQAGIVTTPEAEAGLVDLCRSILADIASWKTAADALRVAANTEG